MDLPFAARSPAAHRQTAEEMESEAARSRFQLQNVLGKGAYGTVYSALDVQTGELVAIKVIPVTDQDREEFKQIQREIGFLADCNHPNVVRYLGSYRHPCELWIVMEYCGGGSVNDLLSATSEPLSEDLIAYICAEALKGLAYLHSLGKVHRDIKCGNILLTSNGDVKIADFGVSAQLTNTMSKRQTFIGTPHWMAPEVIQESRYDGKVDVWALGISAIEMAEMRPPRWNVHPMRVIFMISRDPPPRLGQPDRWSPVFQDFVSQALLKDPKQRPTARYLLQHRFTMAQRPGVAAALLPLIQRAVQYLQESAVAAQQRQAEADTSTLVGLATGRFTWRAATVRADAPAAGSDSADAATLVAAAATLQSGARGAAGLGAHTEAEPASQPRPAPRGGRPPPPPQSPSPLPGTPLSGVRRVSSSAGIDSTVVVKEDYGGTVVVREGLDTAVVRSDGGGGHPALGAGAGPGVLRSPATPAPPGPAEYGATMVVAGGGGTLVERSGTVLRSSEAEEGGADADMDGTGGGYMAAIRAAAAEAQHGDRHARPSESPAAGQPAPQMNEVERVRERLHAIYDGGLVVPLPFFRAEQAQPLALLSAAEPPQGPLLPPSQPLPATPQQQQQQQQQHQQQQAAASAQGIAGALSLRRQGAPPAANGAAGGSLSLSRGASMLQRAAQPAPHPHQQHQPPAVGSATPIDMYGVDPEAYGVVLELVQQSAAMALQRGEVAAEQGQGAVIGSLPPTVLTQLLFHPVLQNLARTLAYNRRCLSMLPLDRRAQSELQESCSQLSAALQCVLSL